MKDCVFCKIINKEIPAEIIYEDEDFISIVDLHPSNYGHSLVLPKTHHENIHELPRDLSQKLIPVIQKISGAIKEAVNADGINLINNNGSVAGQVIFHLHFHIIPRFKDDGLKHFQSKEYEYPEQIKEIGEKIKEKVPNNLK